jgi:protoheme IX farnesyltransferase
VTDEQGGEVSKQVLTYLLALIPLTLLPAVWRTTTEIYLWGAVVLGVIFLASGIFLAWKRTLAGARILFIVSILYLPILGGLMVGTLN